MLKKLGNATEQYQEHVPVAFSVYRVRFHGKNKYCEICDEDPTKKFIKTIREGVKKFKEEFEYPVPLTDVMEAEEAFHHATHCYACHGRLVFDKKDGRFGKLHRVCEHCYYTGFFRGITHNNCNLGMRTPNFTPVFSRNFLKYA